MDMWMKWNDKAGKAVVDLGAPLGMGRTVTNSGNSKAPQGVSGYTIMEAESMDKVVSLLKDHPHFMTPGMSTIEVYEAMPVMM